MENMGRREFLGAAGAAVACGAASALGIHQMALADEQDKNSAAPQTNSASTGDKPVPITEDPERLCERGGTTLTLEEINRIRRERVEAAGDFTKEDGTVVPAVWQKINVLTNTYGIGGPAPETGEALDYIMALFENDEEAAAHYLEMPMGKIFTEYEYAQASGRSVEEAKEICDGLADRGLLYRGASSGMTVYNQLAYIHGFFEESITRLYDPEYVNALYKSFFGAPSFPERVAGGTPLYYAIPCNEEVVADERILPLNDYRGLVERYDTICLMPCCCSLRANTKAGIEVPPIGSEELKAFRNGYEENGHPVERCLAFGDQAEFFLSIGAGRQITKEECYEILDRNVYDEGLVLQMGYFNNSQFICSCHSDCCGVLGGYYKTDRESWEASPIKENASNYLLEYDKESCLQCGACAERCPMRAIEMGDDGHPQITGYCVRCGQCGIVCPVEARKLTARPAEDRLPVPDDHMDDYNRKFGYRLQHGLA